MHKEWCGKSCSDCKKPCRLDESIACSPDCEHLGANGEHTSPECQDCDALPLYKVQVYGYGEVCVRAASYEEARDMVCRVKEQIIKFVDENVDGCGTDIDIIAKVSGRVFTEEVVNKVKAAINTYKASNEGEWDTEGCVGSAIKVLEAEGYEVDFVNPDVVICF